MRPEKEKDIKRNTGKSNRKEEGEVFLLKVNLKGVIHQQKVSELLIKSNSLNGILTHLSWQNTQMFILMLSFRRKTSKITSFAFRYARSKENELIQATQKKKKESESVTGPRFDL